MLDNCRRVSTDWMRRGNGGNVPSVLLANDLPMLTGLLTLQNMLLRPHSVHDQLKVLTDFWPSTTNLSN